MENVSMTLTIFGGKNEKEIIEILQERNFLQICGVCEKCHVQRRLNASKDHKGGLGARCPKCKKFKWYTHTAPWGIPLPLSSNT